MISEDLEDIVYLITILKYNNFGQAAKSLGVSQLTLRRFVQKLEIKLDQKLIYSGHANFVLTEYAGDLLEKLAPKLDMMKQEMFNLIQNDLNCRSNIRIALPHFVADMIMPYLLGAFCREYPNIQLEFSYINLLNYFVPQLLDYDLVFLGCLPNNSQFYVTVFGKLYSRLYCSKNYIVKYGEPTSLQHLVSEHGLRMVSFMNKPIRIAKINDKSDSLRISGTRMSSGAINAQAYIKTDEFIAFSVCKEQLKQDPDIVAVLEDYYVEEFDFCLLKNRNSNLHAVHVVQNILIQQVMKNMKCIVGNLSKNGSVNANQS